MEVVKVTLENEMDLMLAYKKSMKLAELCGLSVLLQTSFATAVSEVVRCVIREKKDPSVLKLKVDSLRTNKKDLVASITTKVNIERDFPEALKYARRLSDNISVRKINDHTEVSFVQSIGLSGLINEARLESFVTYFKSEVPISPYDEIRRKNIMLLEVSEKLRISENKYRDLTRTLPLMIFTTNSLGNISYANKWMLDYFKLAELQPDRTPWTNFLHPVETRRIKDEWDKSMLTQTSFSGQAKLKTREGDNFVWHMISLTPFKNEAQVMSWTGFFVDIHSQKVAEETLKDNKELKEAQKQLLRYQKKLEEKVFELNKSNHDLEQFAYIASHDLQEPLRKISTFSGLLKRHMDNKERVLNYLDKIDVSSTRMSSLIRDVLNYSRLRKADNNFEDVNLQDTINNVMVDMELMIEEKKAVITTSGLPHLNAVPQQLHQLFYNLLSNALKFNNGIPRISISCTPLSSSDIKNIPELHSGVKYVELICSDNGIGFEEQYSRQVFTIFKRLHSRDSYAGTGIGLALCKKIVENHHGVISAQSELGKGTAFRIILPVD
jgi:signal transduction histidine kinase